MTFDLVALLTAAISGIVWLVRLEGKVKLADQRALDALTLGTERYDALVNRLARIEVLLDSLVKFNDH